jgi:hypothetical protein
MHVHGMLSMYPREIGHLLLRSLHEFDDIVGVNHPRRQLQVLTLRDAGPIPNAGERGVRRAAHASP